MSGISKRVSGLWVSGDYGIMKTATDTITTLPANLYADGNNATVGISGNMEQNGTPTPDNPIQPSECGDLETVGEKAGQYKIPILNGQQTTNIYLGSTQTVRQVKKIVFDGSENWQGSDNTVSKYLEIWDYKAGSGVICMSTHYSGANNVSAGGSIPNNSACFYTGEGPRILYVKGSEPITLADFKAYLAAQYAAGTPVTVWYVLATATTGIVNEPLMRIGDYADTVSGITIPTTAGADSFDVLTTLKPSEVTVNYKGWHPVADVHKRENGAWT